MAYPHRGEIGLADLRPTRGREQTGRRPVLVLSVDFFNAGPANLIVVLPLTSTQRDIPLHVKVKKGDGGTRNDSAILCEAIRSVSKDRLISDGAFSRKRSWLEWKIVCVFFSIFDLIAQNGRYSPNANGLAGFVVEGEQHYWVHVAIDRFTGTGNR